MRWVGRPRAWRAVRRAPVLLALAAASFLLAFPLLWMVLASFKTNPEIFRPLQLFPARFDLSYYRQLLTGEWLPYAAQYGSTMLMVGVQTALVVGSASAAAFVFATYRFPLRGPLYALALSTIVIPKQTLVVPTLEWLVGLGLTDSYWGVILPGSVSGLALLFFVEMTRRLPRELFDQARLEGASESALFFRVALPLLRPALLTYAFVHVLFAWHEVLLPLVALSTPEKLSLTVGLGSLFGSFLRVPYAVIMAGFTLATLPVLIAYVLVRKQLRSVLGQFVGE